MRTSNENSPNSMRVDRPAKPLIWMALTAAVAVAALVSYAAYATGMKTESFRLMITGHPEVLYSAATDRPVIALTIDDGPDPQTTPLILDVLAQNHATATFFVIAERIRGNESLMRRIVSEGHEIGNHMTRDEPSIKLTAADFESELLNAHRVLSAYSQPRWFRPGSGWYDEQMLATVGKQQYRCALGSIYPFDTLIPSSWLAQKMILAMARPGKIMILHDCGRRGLRTAQTLAAIIPILQQRGFRICTLSELTRPSAP